MKKSAAAPIIKKKKIIVVSGHHGGAWKVAYADFVTAMMAFFLLMWLLNATTEDQRKGIADYFNPTIPVSRISGGGSGALQGSSIFADDSLARDGTGASNAYAAGDGEKSKKAEAQARLSEIRAAIEARKSDDAARELADHIVTRMTPEGLVVELVDRDGTPLFDLGSSAPSPLLDLLLEVIAPVLATAPNDMAIVGHTDARAYVGASGYSNWDLSADRANVARRRLVAHGLSVGRIAAVTGKADREPLAADPFAAQNRRISVILLSQKAAAEPLRP